VTVNALHNSEKVSKEIEQKPALITVKLDKPFVCEVSDAEVVGPTAAGFDRDGNLIAETIVPLFSKKDYFEKNISIRALAQKKLSKYSAVLDTACLLVHPWGKNYWHWVVDCLTRIEGVEAYQEQTGIKPALVIESNLTSWQIDSLKLLGYEPDDCIRWDGSRVKVKKLIVPSLRRYWGYYDKTYKTYGPVVSPMACRWIRQRVLSNLSNKESEKLSLSSNIFISRRKAFSRQIINENEVLEALAPFEFVAYVLEDLTFSEEVRLFSQAKMVVGAQGARLTNIIFSEKIAVIELFGSHGTNSLFHNLARGLGFQYGYLNC